MTYRFRRGNHYASKINAEQAFEIRRKYNEEGMTQGALAREYGLNISTIGSIVRGESWQGLAHPPRAITEDEIAASQARLLAMMAADGMAPASIAAPEQPAAGAPAIQADSTEPDNSDRIAAEVLRRYGLKVTPDR